MTHLTAALQKPKSLSPSSQAVLTLANLMYKAVESTLKRFPLRKRTTVNARPPKIRHAAACNAQVLQNSPAQQPNQPPRKLVVQVKPGAGMPPPSGGFRDFCYKTILFLSRFSFGYLVGGKVLWAGAFGYIWLTQDLAYANFILSSSAYQTWLHWAGVGLGILIALSRSGTGAFLVDSLKQKLGNQATSSKAKVSQFFSYLKSRIFRDSPLLLLGYLGATVSGVAGKFATFSWKAFYDSHTLLFNVGLPLICLSIEYFLVWMRARKS